MAFTIDQFFKLKKDRPNDTVVELIEFTKSKLENFEESEDDYIASTHDFNVHMDAWRNHRFRLSSSKEKTNTEKELIRKINDKEFAEERAKLRAKLLSYTIRERKKQQKLQTDFLLYQAFLLERGYLRPDVASRIRASITQLKKTQLSVVEEAAFPEALPVQESPGLEWLFWLEYYLGRFNMWRLGFVFGRATFQDLIQFAKNKKWLQDLPQSDGTVDIDTLTKWIDDSRFYGHIFSVAFFALRIIIDIAIIAMESPDNPDVFSEKVGNLVNDLVWAVINLLTNFKEILYIPEGVATCLLMVGLFFDIMWTLRGWYSDWKSFEKKKADYLQQLQDMEPDSLEYQMTMDSLKSLIITWEATNSTNIYAASAGVLLAFACLIPILTALFIPMPAIILPILALVCDILGNAAIGMYKSIEYYSIYKQKESEKDWYDLELVLSASAEEESLSSKTPPKLDWFDKISGSFFEALGLSFDDKLRKLPKPQATNDMDRLIYKGREPQITRKDVLIKEYEFARNNFHCNLLMYVILPTLLFSLSAVCLPASIVTTIVFCGLVKFVIEPWWLKKQQEELEADRATLLSYQDTQELKDIQDSLSLDWYSDRMAPNTEDSSDEKEIIDGDVLEDQEDPRSGITYD